MMVRVQIDSGSRLEKRLRWLVLLVEGNTLGVSKMSDAVWAVFSKVEELRLDRLICRWSTNLEEKLSATNSMPAVENIES